MMGHHPFEKLRAKMSPRCRARNEAAAKKMLARLLRSRKDEEWRAFGRRQLARAYGSDEPEYSERDILGAGH